MAEHIDAILRNWPYDPETLSVRMVKASGGRTVLQMRVDLGLLQLETTGRPDGAHPGGYQTYFDYLIARAMEAGEPFSLSEEDCREIDREFVQFYHRRLCWLRLQEYRRAAADAEHTLGLMDFCRLHTDDLEWLMSHEQYRPYVLMHRVQAQALAELEASQPDAAIACIDQGLEELREFFRRYASDEEFEEDDIVARLRDFRDTLREQFDPRFALQRQLEEAIAAEEYERAAAIRDELARLDKRGRR
ncbi:MAG: UvrB/UvrC protein [Pirellulaceae bacterium]|nr:MAG: UvrB/UvrC protein [Pirellulaceae bacterium]